MSNNDLVPMNHNAVKLYVRSFSRPTKREENSHVTREKNQSLGTTQIHSFYIGDPAIEDDAMSNNVLVPMNHIAVKLSTFYKCVGEKYCT